ncbi:hypothetical protein SOV_04720 [Sporomusa ovata DSM 2662]|uniref:DUF4054 domain-containing protein n=1 Tax=Sporomusa ovata TaxID=2378 RepID=A0A0U1KWH5_9FIRM|nr:DUF4054 domain-containing protein [Sporomusa ovata]EQB28142.1 hypothetical protein SOV_2c10650 [Sporomusa ovata DSM 2662]CQR71676.1 hypothetical protein SpAn4DRAFT_3542 [Sporomusa ovata]
MYIYDSGGASIIAAASNLRSGDNPAYTFADFYAVYPAYAPRTVDSVTTYLVDPSIADMYIAMAHVVVKESRWHVRWKFAMGLFIAHFLTLYLQSLADANSTASQVVAAGQTRGLMASKSIGDVSVSYDFSTIAQGLDGWAAWNLTTFGVQYATLAKIVGKGGMYVW